MSRALCCLVALVLVASPAVAGWDAVSLTKKPAGLFGPTSLKDVTGHSGAEAQGLGLGTMDIDVKPMTIGTATGTPFFGPPAGAVLFDALVNPDGSNKCVYAPDSNPVSIFTESFTTAPGTTYIEVSFNTQISFPAGTTLDGAGLTCQVTQGSTTVPCSATAEMPFLLRRSSSTMNQLGMQSYHGYVQANPNTATTVTIKITTTGSMPALMCYNNLVLRF